MIEENSQNSAHLVGVCGAGMKALAEILLDANWAVSGSDLLPPNPSLQKLIRRGLNFHQGHDANNVPQTAECLVFSQAIPLQNSERSTAERRGISQYSYAQFVGRLMRQQTGVAIAGTHGKSTTTAMTACILDAAQRLSAVVLGAELCEGGRNGWSGPGDLFVAESCEFQQSFLEFQPRYSALLSIEPDHFDCYPDLDSLTTAFRQFTARTDDDGVLLFNDDCPNSCAVARAASTGARRVSFGLRETADWSARHPVLTASGSRFCLCHRGQATTEIELALHGRHNLMNALAAAAICSEIGISPEIIRTTLARFRGIRRRLEFVGDFRGVTIVDDYAHHPTAVKITLETLREVMGTRHIKCVFQPHQVQRTLVLMEQFAASFADADEVLIAPIFAARESVSEQPILVSSELARRIQSNGVAARSFTSLDQIVSTLEDAWNPGDVIVTMGAGDIDRIYHECTRRVQADSSS